MNYYNPLSSLLSNYQPLLTPPMQTVPQRQPNLANPFNSLAYGAAASLNQKRHFDSLGEVTMNDLEALMYGATKKIKPNQGIDANTINLLRNMNEMNNNPLASRNAFVPNKKPREVINLEDDDDVIPLSNPLDFYRSQQALPSVNLQATNISNPNYLTNLLNQNNPLWGNQYNSLSSANLLQNFNSSWNRPSFQELALMEQLKQNQNAQLLQQLMAQQQQQSFIPPVQNDLLASQINMLRASKQNSSLSVETQPTVKNNFITIDEDESIPQEKPTKKVNDVGFRLHTDKTPSKSFSGFQLRQSPVKKTQEMAIKTEIPQEKPAVKTVTKLEAEPQEQIIKGDSTESVTTQANSLWIENEVSVEAPGSPASETSEYANTDIYAVIPEFELIEPNLERRVRKPKLVWNPDSEEAKVYRESAENIEKIVAMQITSETKLIETLRKYNMNPQEAYEKIKRNKASYKIYFKVQRQKRGDNLY